VTGYPDRPPVRPGVIVSDYLTGVFNAFAIVSALHERERRARETGTPPAPVGRASLYESILRIMEHTLAAYDRLGVVRERRQSAEELGAARQLGDEGRKYVCIIAAGDGLFRVSRARWNARTSCATPASGRWRRAPRTAREINAIVAAWCHARTARIQDVLERHESRSASPTRSRTSSPIRTSRRAGTS
jgi:crotonobetainyl-CoA:carnitine CoA-transferase CaiB-like acyl-CoA transferase